MPSTTSSSMNADAARSCFRTRQRPMSPELTASAAFAIAAVVTYLVTPVAIAAAVRAKFFDLPAGYKGHALPTPYLGGTAIIVGILAAVASVDGGPAAHPLLIVLAVTVWVLGTIDDRF